MTQDPRHDLKQGLAAAWPICLGYAPIGMAFGVIARQAGLTPLQIGLMSVLVFAGSAQFIAVSMIASGAAALSIVATTFIVNLRHLLMSSALTLFVKNEKKGRLALLAYGVTDESFAVNFSKYRESYWNTNRSLVVNHTANLAWIVSTVAGGYGGQYIPPGAFGTDYALIAMFICLLVFQLNGPRYVVAALLSAGLSLGISLIFPGNIHIVLASILAAALGAAIQRRRAREGGVMTDTEYLLLLFGMGLVTYLPRWLPLAFLSGRSLPPAVTEWLDLIPAAILAALLAPALLTDDPNRQLTLLRPELWVALPTFLFALKTRSLGGTVVVGMALFWLSGKLL